MKFSFELKNAIIYVLFGFLWIVFTSEAVLLIAMSPEQLAKIEIFKGLAYVFVTGVLLFYFTRRRVRVENFLFGKLRETRKELIKSKESLVIKNKKLEEYAFITSHNLRRPLANILGLVELLEEGGSDSTLKDEVHKRLKTSAHELDDVIKDSAKLISDDDEQLK